MVSDVPQLKQYVTATDISIGLKVSRQSVNRMIRDGKFETAKRIGDNNPFYVVDRAEYNKVKRARDRAASKA